MTTEKKPTEKKAADKPNQELANIEKTMADNVLNRVKAFTATKAIRLPADYAPENALKSAWLILLETTTSKNDGERPVLDVCTKESIANALLNMVLQGLNPVKKQCDFIAYGDKLTMQREYHGTIALAKRYGGVREAVGNVVYEGDEFAYTIDERGYKTITKHIQQLDNIDSNKIKGAYATLLFEDQERPPYVEVMTMAQIRQSWMQGATKGASPAHKNFPDRMAQKTVIGRACTLFISSSDDSALFEDPETDNFTINVRQQVLENANKEQLSIEDAVPENVDMETGEIKETPRATGNGKDLQAEPAGTLFNEGQNKPGF